MDRAISAEAAVDIRSDSDRSLEEFTGWFVVETQPNKERFALENLKRQCFRTFFPRFLKTRRHARRADTVLSPLFPGYLFVKTEDGHQTVRPVNGTFGVRRYVASARGKPAAMPAGVMANLVARCKNEIVQRILEPIPGSSVRILNGPLSNRLATVEALDHHGRVRLLLELLGRNVQVTVEHAAIGPA